MNLGYIIAALIGASVTIIVNWYQVKKNIERIQYQFDLEQKRENKDFVIKLKLEKSSELIEKVSELSGMNMVVFSYLINKDTDAKQAYVDKFYVLMREITVLVNYFPDSKNAWDDFKKSNDDIVSVKIASPIINNAKVIIDNAFTEETLANSEKLNDFFKLVSAEIDKIMNELMQ